MFLDANSVARVYLLQAHVHADHAEEIASRRPAVAAKRKQAQPHDGYINIEFRLFNVIDGQPEPPPATHDVHTCWGTQLCISLSPKNYVVSHRRCP